MRKSNFTMREMLLAMIALAAIAAAISANWRSSPTDIPKLIRPQKLVEEVGKEMNIGFAGPFPPQESGGGGGGKYETRLTYAVHFSLDQDASPEALLGGVRQKVKDTIFDQDCVLTGEGWSGADENHLEQFKFSYARNKTSGSVFVRLFPGNMDGNRDATTRDWMIWFYLYENCR